jgi:transcriptional regulator with XRE-family HTH domain
MEPLTVSKGAMAHGKDRKFGQVIRDRRRRLRLSRQELARRIKTSIPYVGHLESGERTPSEKVLRRLAQALGIDRRELFILAHPGATEVTSGPKKA